MPFTRTIRFVFMFLALVIIADCLVPGRSFQEVAEEVVMEQQRNYKTPGNSHYTYRVRTPQNYVLVSQSFATALTIGQPFEYRLSPLFNEINGYRLDDSYPFQRHSMRWFAGLIFPLLAIGILLISFKYPNKYGTLFFVVQALLLADLVYLLY